MTDPNRNALWGRCIVEELVAAGVTDVCVSPGSRSTPLTVALADDERVTIHSHLDERSAAFYALGRGKRTGTPTAVVTTSGTAAAELLPAVVEAHQSRTPLVLLTADRPPELRDSGANQTIDQTSLYGDRLRWFRDLGEPQMRPRALRSLRTAVARGVGQATGTPAGPVHMNCPFRKPLEPTEIPEDVPQTLLENDAEVVAGRDGPWVEVTPGTPTLEAADAARIADRLSDAERPMLVAGPADDAPPEPSLLVELADGLGAPVLADPLSGARFGSHVGDGSASGSERSFIIGGYDGMYDALDDGPMPDVVLRFGASPTSKPLRHALREADCAQFVVDPAGGWREAEFTATDLVVADPTRLLERLLESGQIDADRPVGEGGWLDEFAAAESAHWDLVGGAADEWFEGGIVADVFAHAPSPATIVTSNSMPVRDADRFARSRDATLTVLGNRGASGIDGVVSTALGAGSAAEEEPLILLVGDLAYYHDMNGLLALERCDVDATVVLVNNDGGGIFHQLPISEFDPPFTEQFVTPHGLDFSATEELYDLEFRRATDRSSFRAAYRNSLDRAGTQVIETPTEAPESHVIRDRLAAELDRALSE